MIIDPSRTFPSERNPPRRSNSANWPIPSRLRVVRCAEWSETASQLPAWHSLTSSFELPLSCNLLFLLSRGQNSHGRVHLVQSNEVSDRIRVEVTVNYREDDAIDLVKVCQVEAEPGQSGVGIFTTHRLNEYNNFHIDFEVVVCLPKSPSRYPLAIEAFETDMPMFSHVVNSLAKTVTFRKITLRTANVSIIAQSLAGEVVEFNTANAAICGSIIASSAVRLQTANGMIKVDVTLQHVDSSSFSELVMRTSNGSILSVVTLSTPNTMRGGHFNVLAETALGNIELDIPSSPVDSTLHLAARTSMANANVALHKAYEGSFVVSTAMGTSRVSHNNRETDPAGNNRIRKVGYNHRSYTHASGFASWSEHPNAPSGHVEVSTSMGNTFLKL